ncbi:MAG TPA: hydrogenase maturation protease [Gemmatimonadaceae bacterium]|nr:hydrogenase maturation protease [Gemmatimonadaceae bacterium]
MNPSPLLVIGVGNGARRDDGVGLAVARRLAALQTDGIACAECDGDALWLLDLWRDHPFVIVVDAMRSGAEPGSIRRFGTDDVAQPPCTALHSSHAYGIFDAVRLAAALGESPRQLVLYGVEADDTGYGDTLTPDVAAAVEPLVRRILLEHALATYGAATPPAAPTRT